MTSRVTIPPHVTSTDLSLLLLLMLSQASSAAFSSGQGLIDIEPRQILLLDGSGERFVGENGSSSPGESNYFKLLERDRDSLLVGARNFVYNLSMTTMVPGHRIMWAPPKNIVETCTMKGKPHEDCQNYIRVLAKQSEGQVLICGTYAFSPKCRTYVYDIGLAQFKMYEQFDGEAISPYDPHDNSTAIYLRKTDEIIAGTVSDFVGNDPLIYRKKLSAKTGDEGIRTQRDDVRVLDNPNFVASFEYKEHIYFWFRERAAEAMDNNEERQVYARVGRVCRGDKGGPRPAHDRWTSFLKARLNCSLSAATPFYFNELKSVSGPVAATNGDSRVYAVFTTPDSMVRMSAVCVFSMKTIREIFDKDTFKYQKSVTSLWQGVPRQEIPSPRPGQCVQDSTKLPEATLSFITRNPLLNQAVNSIRPPLFVEGASRAELTQIAVLPKVSALDGSTYDVLYVGTSDGRVVKVLDRGEGRAVLIQSSRVFRNGAPVVNLLTTATRVVVVSADEIASLPTEQCAHALTCKHCVRLQDPHCAWDERTTSCVSRESWRGGDVIQNIVLGESSQCPDTGEEQAAGIIVNDGTERMQVSASGVSGVSAPGQLAHSSQTLALSLLFAIVIASAVGFFVGYRIANSRRLAETHHSASSTSSDYDSFGRARLTRHDSLTASTKLEHVYGGPPTKQSVDAVSLVMPTAMSVSAHSAHGGTASGATTPGRDRNAMMTSLNNTTLPRDYKVKKVYL